MTPELLQSEQTAFDEAPVRKRRRLEVEKAAMKAAMKVAAGKEKAAAKVLVKKAKKAAREAAKKAAKNAWRPKPKPCQECGVEIDPKKTSYSTRRGWEERKYCGRACAAAAGHRDPQKFTRKSLIEYQEQIKSDSKAVQEMARRALARKSLLYFTKRTHPKYSAGWVHADVCARLERFAHQVMEQKSPRLMLLLPPRHGKSEIASIRFPAWYLGHNPGHEIINVGYSLDLPMRWSRKVRELVRDPAYEAVFPATRLDPESSALEAWLTTMGGGFTAAGVGGGITGKGCFSAHALVKSRERGIISLSKLRVGEHVYAYDHEQRRGVFTPVLAVHASRHPVGAGRYAGVRCTDDHELFSPRGGGYCSAASIVQQGLPVLRQREVEELARVCGVQCDPTSEADSPPSMPQVWWPEGCARVPVCVVPCAQYYGISSTDLRALRKDLRVSEGGGGQAHTAIPRGLLFQDVFAQGPARAGVRGGAAPVLPAMQRAVDSEGPARVLRNAVLRRLPPRLLDVWGRLRRLLHRIVPETEAADNRARWAQVCADFGGPSSGDPSRRPRSGEQRSGEFDYVVEGGARALSCAPGRCAGDISSLVVRTRREPHLVMDVQTSTSNLFVDGVLAHNCHILTIDDPIKNMEEADSNTTRESLWDWFWSTAYTRLAPGGGVLLIQCLTGDTPVRMANGSERRLDAVRPGDEVATFDAGRLSVSKVLRQRSSGRDKVLKITTCSGKMVRANARHPFLVSDCGGLRWIRAQNLNTASRIVAYRGSGGNGEAKHVPQTGVTNPPSAEVCATSTIIGLNGLPAIGPPRTTRLTSALGILNTAMAYLRRNMTVFTPPRGVSAQFVMKRAPQARPVDGGMLCVSTTATIPVGSEDCSATVATRRRGTSGTLVLPESWANTSDFTTERVVSVVPAGEEEVFDLQIEGTENFIANGLASHNTWWSADDLAGRLQVLSETSPDADQYEVVKYPALAEAYEYRLSQTLEIVRSLTPLHGAATEAARAVEAGSGRYLPVPCESGDMELLRVPGDALHPARYDAGALGKIKASSLPRVWSALYQQNPVPDEGMLFRKDYFAYTAACPRPSELYVYQAWDFAIGQKQQNDWTVGATLIHDYSDRLYVAEIFRIKTDAFGIVDAMVNAYIRWGQDAGYYLLGVEDGVIWKSIAPLFNRRMREKNVYIPTEVLKPLTDKLARARPLQGRMQQHNIVFPKDALWLGECERELLRFPAGAHDDIVDALAWAVILATGKSPPRQWAPPPVKGWKDRLGELSMSDFNHMGA